MKHSEYGSLYNVAPDLKKIAFDIVNFQKRSHVLSTESCLIFTEAHCCLRELAKEIIVYMLNCKNRIHEELIQNSSPVAYVNEGEVIEHCTTSLLNRHTTMGTTQAKYQHSCRSV